MSVLRKDRKATDEKVKAVYDRGVRDAKAIARELSMGESTAFRAMKRQGLDGPRKLRVKGILPDTGLPDGWDAVAAMADRQDEVQEKIAVRYSQEVVIDDSLPVAVAMFSDLHLGGPHCDYKAIRRDTELVAATDGFYGIAAGDYSDNWIGKFAHIQGEQAVSFKTELGMVDAWFKTLDGKLLCVVSGNHDNRSIVAAGIDRIRSILRGAQLLYDTDEVVFTLKLGDGAWTIKVRHDWMGRSIYNPTHGIERDPKFGDGTFDIGIGGHIHRGCLFREFLIHGRRTLAVMLGTYKLFDRYAVKMGYPQSPQDPSGALILYPDGRLWHTQDLQTAADFVTWERSRLSRKKR